MRRYSCFSGALLLLLLSASTRMGAQPVSGAEVTFCRSLILNLANPHLDEQSMTRHLAHLRGVLELSRSDSEKFELAVVRIRTRLGVLVTEEKTILGSRAVLSGEDRDRLAVLTAQRDNDLAAVVATLVNSLSPPAMARLRKLAEKYQQIVTMKGQ